MGWGLRGIWGGIAGAFAAQALSLGALVWGFADFEGIAAFITDQKDTFMRMPGIVATDICV